MKPARRATEVSGITQHSIADAKERLPDLIELALRGEDVVITRDGARVVPLRPVQPPPRASPGVEWVLARRAQWLLVRDRYGQGD